MRHNRTPIVALALVMTAVTAWTIACRTDVTKVCQRLEALMDEAGQAADYHESACRDHVGSVADRCTNFDELVTCWIGAEDLRAFGRCETACAAE